MVARLKLFNFIFLGSTTFFANTIIAQDCSELLKHGIYNYFNQTSNVQEYSFLKKNICEVYNEYKLDVSQGNVKASYGMFGGSGGYSRTEIESMGKLLCEGEQQENAMSSIIGNAARVISDDMMRAYRECINLREKASLTLNTTFNQGPNETIVAYSLTPATGVIGKVQEITITPVDAFTCTGGLKDAADNGEDITSVLSMSCQRKVETTAYKDGTLTVHAPAAAIQIATSASSITTHFLPIFPSPPEIPRNVGEIVASILSEQQFYQLNSPNEWVLADGRTIDNNSAYARIANRNVVPDLRGVFLRGKNYDRDILTGNSSGDLDLGTYEGDAFEDHVHIYQRPAYPEGRTQRPVNNARAQYEGWDVGDGPKVLAGPDATGDAVNLDRSPDGNAEETRPRSVTVNYFIRIN